MRRVAIALAALLGSPALAEDFHLICSGSGVADHSDTITTNINKSDGKTEQRTTTVDNQVPFQGDATVEIVDGVGRIHLPVGILPDVSGGKDGWFELRNLVVEQNQITAKAAVTIFNRPNVRIDRQAGSLSIDGNIGRFSGACRLHDPEKRAF